MPGSKSSSRTTKNDITIYCFRCALAQLSLGVALAALTCMTRVAPPRRLVPMRIRRQFFSRAVCQWQHDDEVTSLPGRFRGTPPVSLVPAACVCHRLLPPIPTRTALTGIQLVLTLRGVLWRLAPSLCQIPGWPTALPARSCMRWRVIKPAHIRP